MDPITFRRWRQLHYWDPAEKLRELRGLEGDILARIAEEFPGQELDPDARQVLNLRTNETKRWREGRDAALFTYGIGLALKRRIGFVMEEADDYDFVTAWVDGDTAHYCPVQLKELAPDERAGDVDDVLGGLTDKYAPSKTVLAVRLNREEHLILDRDWPRVPFAQLWFFWASSPDGATFSMYGDALGDQPQMWTYKYPK